MRDALKTITTRVPSSIQLHMWLIHWPQAGLVVEPSFVECNAGGRKDERSVPGKCSDPPLHKLSHEFSLTNIQNTPYTNTLTKTPVVCSQKSHMQFQLVWTWEREFTTHHITHFQTTNIYLNIRPPRLRLTSRHHSCCCFCWTETQGLPMQFVLLPVLPHLGQHTYTHSFSLLQPTIICAAPQICILLGGTHRRIYSLLCIKIRNFYIYHHIHNITHTHSLRWVCCAARGKGGAEYEMQLTFERDFARPKGFVRWVLLSGEQTRGGNQKHRGKETNIHDNTIVTAATWLERCKLSKNENEKPHHFIPDDTSTQRRSPYLIYKVWTMKRRGAWSEVDVCVWCVCEIVYAWIMFKYCMGILKFSCQKSPTRTDPEGGHSNNAILIILLKSKRNIL